MIILTWFHMLVLHAWIMLLPKSLYLTTPTAFIWWMIKRGKITDIVWVRPETCCIWDKEDRCPMMLRVSPKATPDIRQQVAGVWQWIYMCGWGFEFGKVRAALLIAVLITTVHLSEWHVELNGYTFHKDDIQKANGYQRGLSMTVWPHRDPANP